MENIRKQTDLCLLCRTNEASQKNSHIIPKFMGAGLFYGTKPRHSILWSKGGKKEKVQDIIKDDYLFCSNCEKCFSVLETYCSLRFERFNNIRYFKNFSRFKYGDFEYAEFKEVNIKIYNLFIYSIVWRVSVSQNLAFLNFNLPQYEEERLRILLTERIMPTQTGLLENLDSFKTLPEHAHILIRPKKKLRPPTSMLSAASLNENMHQLHLVDYFVIYLTDRNKLIESLIRIDNNRVDGCVKVGLSDPQQWKDFNFGMVREAIQ